MRPLWAVPACHGRNKFFGRLRPGSFVWDKSHRLCGPYMPCWWQFWVCGPITFWQDSYTQPHGAAPINPLSALAAYTMFGGYTIFGGVILLTISYSYFIGRDGYTLGIAQEASSLARSPWDAALRRGRLKRRNGYVGVGTQLWDSVGAGWMTPGHCAQSTYQ